MRAFRGMRLGKYEGILRREQPVDETVILLHLPLPLAGVSMWIERGSQRNEQPPARPSNALPPRSVCGGGVSRMTELSPTAIRQERMDGPALVGMLAGRFFAFSAAICTAHL